MLRFAIIGTGRISHTFMKAALKVPGFKLEAVYSRSQDSGRAFGSVYGVETRYIPHLRPWGMTRRWTRYT